MFFTNKGMGRHHAWFTHLVLVKEKYGTNREKVHLDLREKRAKIEGGEMSL